MEIGGPLQPADLVVGPFVTAFTPSHLPGLPFAVRTGTGSRDAGSWQGAATIDNAEIRCCQTPAGNKPVDLKKDASMAAIYSDLEGKSVLVTGGASGIGASIVRAFARQKAKVGFLDIARQPASRLVEELAGEGASVHFEPCDLTDIAALRGAVERIRSRIGPVRVLVSNAAHDERHETETVTPEYWDDRMAVNLKHQFFAA